MIHASHKLYDKEFCYLGTIKVMAEVGAAVVEDTVHRSELIGEKLSVSPCVFDNQSRGKQEHNTWKNELEEPSCDITKMSDRVNMDYSIPNLLQLYSCVKGS